MKEKRLYRIEFPNGHVFAQCGDDEHFTSVDPTSVDPREPWEFNFSEKEIRRIEPLNLMVFAMEADSNE